MGDRLKFTPEERACLKKCLDKFMSCADKVFGGNDILDFVEGAKIMANKAGVQRNDIREDVRTREMTEVVVYATNEVARNAAFLLANMYGYAEYGNKYEGYSSVTIDDECVEPRKTATRTEEVTQVKKNVELTGDQKWHMKELKMRAIQLKNLGERRQGPLFSMSYAAYTKSLEFLVQSNLDIPEDCWYEPDNVKRPDEECGSSDTTRVIKKPCIRGAGGSEECDPRETAPGTTGSGGESAKKPAAGGGGGAPAGGGGGAAAGGRKGAPAGGGGGAAAGRVRGAAAGGGGGAAAGGGGGAPAGRVRGAAAGRPGRADAGRPGRADAGAEGKAGDAAEGGAGGVAEDEDGVDEHEGWTVVGDGQSGS